MSSGSSRPSPNYIPSTHPAPPGGPSSGSSFSTPPVQQNQFNQNWNRANPNFQVELVPPQGDDIRIVMSNNHGQRTLIINRDQPLARPEFERLLRQTLADQYGYTPDQIEIHR